MKILDHGYLELVEYWGSDERVIESARMSTGKGFLGWGPILRHEDHCKLESVKFCTCTPIKKDGDEKLLRRLYTHKHTTPFEMCGATFEVQAPIFVFREWMRHRTLSYNEFSARYAELPNLMYMPFDERLTASKQSTTNKQSSQEGFNLQDVFAFKEVLALAYHESRTAYDTLLRQGVSKEIARLVIPVSQYSKMRVSGNLYNWIRFLHLRLPKDAQWEIRQFAHAISGYLMLKFPRTMHLFGEEYDALNT